MFTSVPLPLLTVALSISVITSSSTLTSALPQDPRLERFRYETKDDPALPRYDPQENDISYWRTLTTNVMQNKMMTRPIEGVAKNVILFLGDGMSIPTISAARIYMGQLNNQSGENSRFSFEDFPYTGLSKTYCVNKQVADSACSSTAYLGGVKANYGTLGVTASVPRGDCSMSGDPQYQVDTILSWAQAAGKATGLVTTTRITHASPAGNYAHSADRDWESDHNVQTEKHSADPHYCQDIAQQLVYNAPGKNCKVLMGGGRSKFYRANLLNPAWGEGERRDNRSLVDDWHQDKQYRGKAKYVTDRDQLLQVDTKHTDYLLGLFQPDHMLYHLEEGSEKQPTLAEMTSVAIKMLKKERKGFYLFVEGGKIDFAHHSNFARRGLDETVEFHKAVQVALDMVDERDTLIVVTADHAHTMSFAGYPRRGDDILGAVMQGDRDHLIYSTLSYANGPSAEIDRTGKRRDISKDNLHDPKYQYPSLVNMKDETHGGDDVSVYARGPWAHLLTGNYEQTLIPHVMAYAARIGPMANISTVSAASALSASFVTAILVLALVALRGM